MTTRHPECTFIVVSNNIPWAKQALLSAATNESSIIFAPESLSPEVSLVLLTRMDGLILSVGTFSWWSAYLSRTATDVVYFSGAPEPLTFYDVIFRAEDYYLPHWIGLNA